MPNGRTENISPHVISPGASPPDGGGRAEVLTQTTEFVYAASTPGYFSRIASATMLPIADSLEPCRVPLDVDRLRTDHLVAQTARLCVGIVDDRLHVRPRRDADVLGDAGRRAGPLDVLPFTIICTTE